MGFPMSRSLFERRMVLFALLPLCFVLMHGLSVAQCTCSGTQQSRQIDICLGGITYPVVVTYCTTTYCPPAPLADPCNPNSLGIDARTELISICPAPAGSTGPLPTTDYVRLVGATVSAMSFCHGNQLGIALCIPQPDYTWIIRTPQCMSVNVNGCLVACAGTPCCGYLVRYRPNHPAPGSCNTNLMSMCGSSSGGFACPPGATCNNIGCPPPDHACW